jgi:hypothetical protein
MKVGSIDTIHDRFSAEVLVQTRWREPLLDGKRFETVGIHVVSGVQV